MTSEIERRRREIEILRLKAEPPAGTSIPMTAEKARAVAEVARMAAERGLRPWIRD